ncbi:hypothetical protein BDA96_02G343400 [Sorghum bicolor]|nr:hypothetical protein BDA96_02G343400 [Sorghum bicolor]
MENLSLLSLVVLLAGSPLAAAAWSESESVVACGGRSGSSSYVANSTYEANLRHLAAVLPAETEASHYHSVDRAIGYWPNRVQASASCWTWTDADGDCATCIAEAFKEVERVCPFRREATFSGIDCYLRLAEFRIFSIVVFGNTMVQALVMGMIFQALGIACLFFLFIQAWRHDPKKGNMNTSINSEYEASIHHLAAMLRSEKTTASPGLYTEYVVGDLPDGVYAVSRCRNGTDSSSCRACVTLALQEARTACPYHRESAFFNGNCSLHLLPAVHFDDLVLSETETEKRNIVMRNLSLAMVFQAIGFAWLFFLLLQDSRNRKRCSEM